MLRSSLRRVLPHRQTHTRAMSSKVQNLTRPANWKTLAPFPPSGTLTYAAQSKLPHLPVPALEHTVEQLKESFIPLAKSQEELESARRKIDVFQKEAGKLQERLQKRAEEKEHWLEEWWDDGGYMGYRDSVVVNVSYYYGFSPVPKHKGQSPAVVAADLTRSALLFRKKLLNGQVAPEGTKEGPWCMDSWRYMFDACRIPGAEGLDWVTSHVKSTDTGDDGHVIVIRKGRFWKVDASSGGRLLSSKELLRQFEHIYDNTTEEHPAVGVLTSANRDLWAKDYTELSSDPHNASILETIHSAAFVVCLDTETPNDIVNFSRGLWHGAYDSTKPLLGLRNRWVDKPVQFIVFDNARAGIMGEHSVMDGTPTQRMCDDVLDAINSPDFDKDVATSSSSGSVKPQPLDWHVSKKTNEAIERATNEARELVGSQVLGYVSTSYGKKAIKSFGVSPDSWGQMTIQLAYARLLKSTGNQRDGATYEAAATRKFLKGRTETIRVVSSESDAWVAAMDDMTVEVGKKKDMFKAAASKHIERAKRAGNGLGADRHLLGLRYCVADGESVPELYDDPLYLRSKKWVLSTSAIHSKWFEAYGWGEVVPDGFGVPYTTGFDDHMQFTVTSRKEMPNREFCAQLETAAEDMYELFAGKHTSPVKAKL